MTSFGFELEDARHNVRIIVTGVTITRHGDDWQKIQEIIPFIGGPVTIGPTQDEEHQGMQLLIQRLGQTLGAEGQPLVPIEDIPAIGTDPKTWALVQIPHHAVTWEMTFDHYPIHNQEMVIMEWRTRPIYIPTTADEEAIHPLSASILKNIKTLIGAKNPRQDLHVGGGWYVFNPKAADRGDILNITSSPAILISACSFLPERFHFRFEYLWEESFLNFTVHYKITEHERRDNTLDPQVTVSIDFTHFAASDPETLKKLSTGLPKNNPSVKIFDALIPQTTTAARNAIFMAAQEIHLHDTPAVYRHLPTLAGIFGIALYTVSVLAQADTMGNVNKPFVGLGKNAFTILPKTPPEALLKYVRFFDSTEYSIRISALFGCAIKHACRLLTTLGVVPKANLFVSNFSWIRLVSLLELDDAGRIGEKLGWTNGHRPLRRTPEVVSRTLKYALAGWFYSGKMDREQFMGALHQHGEARIDNFQNIISSFSDAMTGFLTARGGLNELPLTPPSGGPGAGRPKFELRILDRINPRTTLPQIKSIISKAHALSQRTDVFFGGPRPEEPTEPTTPGPGPQAPGQYFYGWSRPVPGDADDSLWRLEE